MHTITTRISDEKYALISRYVKTNQLSLCAFVGNSMLDKVEYDLALDEKRIIQAKERVDAEKRYTADEVWKELGI